MKKLLLPLMLIVAGAGVGGGAAIAARAVLGPPGTTHAPVTETAFVPAAKITAPLVLGDGRLAGYVSFDAALEVPADQEASVTQRLPLLLHAINMRTYRTPLATGRDGLLPDISGLRAVTLAAAREAFGAHAVRRVAITRAEPV